MTTDIDLDPALPGRRSLTTALIAPDVDEGYPFDGTLFTGTFDGNDCNILNLTINTNGLENDYIGLFGRTDTNSVISNLSVRDVSITGGNDSDYLGGLVGLNHHGSVTNCFATGEVTGGDNYIGGLVGLNYDGIVTDCYATDAVSGDGYIGGMVGRNGEYGTVTNCYAIGAVSGGEHIGGLVGYNGGGSVTNCYAIGVVTGDDYVGGLVGAGGGVTNSFWDIETSGTTVSRGGIGLTTSQMQQSIYYAAHYWAGTTWTIDDGNDYPHLAWENVPGEFITDPVVTMAGSGTAEAPWVIESKDDFLLVAAGSFFWDKHYILNTDIDLSGTTYTYALIGFDNDNPFTGTFDGNDHIISNLTIEGGSYLGLFGYIGEGGLVGNLGLEDVNITGTDAYVGGLVGAIYEGSVTNCYANGNGEVSGVYNVGGLVGHSYRGSVTNCYATGSVTGGSYVGGLVGENSGSITDCYATGAVADGGGGLVGCNRGSVTKCYATGAVADGGGGLVGLQYDGTVTNSFWDVEASGTTVSAGGMGLTTSQMQQSIYYAAHYWGGATWTIDDGNDYPHLAWEGAPGEFITDPVVTMAGSGTAEDPWVIGSKDDFFVVCAGPFFWDKHYILNTDIDLSGVTYAQALIGYDNDNSFTGSFDGNGHVISKLAIEGQYYLGLFGFVGEGGFVGNLGLEDVNIIGTGELVGGLVGLNYYGTVTNCYATGAVTGDDRVGGLVGGNGGSMTNCYATGAVTGDDRVGGLVGENGGSVTDCYSTVTVTGESSVGGLSGDNSGNITESYATGEVTGSDDYVGGLVGRNSYDNITDCYATGAVSGFNYVGGLVGRNKDSNITNSYATGAVSGTDYLGGLVGFDYESGGVFVTSYFLDPNDGGGPDNGIGEPLTNIEMKQQASFVNWDFIGPADGPNDIWSICEAMNYPKLLWSIPLADMLCPDGVTFIDYSYFADHWLWTDYGDVNGLELSSNGKIENADFALFANCWNQGLSNSCIKADYNGDNAVDSADVQILFDKWLATDYGDCEGAELTGDGFVGIDDALAFSSQWLQGF